MYKSKSLIKEEEENQVKAKSKEAAEKQMHSDKLQTQAEAN